LNRIEALIWVSNDRVNIPPIRAIAGYGTAASGAKPPFKRRVFEAKHRRLQNRECHNAHGVDILGRGRD